MRPKKQTPKSERVRPNRALCEASAACAATDVEALVRSLSLERKIGHMVMGRGLDLFAEETRTMLERGRMANIQAKSGANQSQTIAAIQRSLPLPMLVGTDMENGFSGAGFRGTDMPCAMALGAINDEKAAYMWAAMAAREARAYGVNMVYGPVVDFAASPESPLCNIRLLGSEVDNVIRLAAAMVRGYQDNGMIVAAKHYPGVGRSPVDSHIERSRLECNRATFRREELRIYKELVAKTGLSGVMSAHILVPCMDPNNMATMSAILVRVLRQQGFNGVLITDSLAMKGLRAFIAEDELLPAVLASGHDIILIDYSQPPENQFRQLLATVKSGRVPERSIDVSVARILKAKLHVAGTKPEPADKFAHRKFSLSISRRAITVKGPFDAWRRTDWLKKTLIIIARAAPVSEVQAELENKSESEIEQLMHRHFPRCKMLVINDNPSPLEMERTLNAALDYERVLFITYALPHSYKGTADLSRSLLAMIGGLRHKIDCLILFGNPFAARHLPNLPIVMFPYWGGHAERAAVETLAGKNKPTGRLPVEW